TTHTLCPYTTLFRSKTKITHTLREYQGTRGFDFLGWTVRQFPVGKTHTGRANQNTPPLGFKTIITPSKEAVHHHITELGEVVKKDRKSTRLNSSHQI